MTAKEAKVIATGNIHTQTILKDIYENISKAAKSGDLSITLYDKHINEAVRKTLEDDGYIIKNTHYALGTKISWEKV